MSAQSPIHPYTEKHEPDDRREPLRSVAADSDRREREGDGHPIVAGTPVVVRRNAGLAALIGAGASAIAIAYLWRASQSGVTLDWVLCGVMALIASYYLSTLLDSRTPLLVADDLGVRIRLGTQWRGLPWEAVNQVVVEPRRGPFRDGRLVFSPHSLGRALDGLDGRARRQALLNQKLYGAALAVPLGLTTKVSVDGTEALEEGIAALAHGRADVVVLQPEPADRSAERTPRGDPGAAPVELPAAVEADKAEQPSEEAATGSQPAPRRLRWRRRAAVPADETDPENDPENDPDGAPDDVTDDVPEVITGPTAASAGARVDERAEESDDRVDAPAARQAEGTFFWSVEDGEDGLADLPDLPDAADEPRPETADRPAARRSPLGGIATIVSRVAKGRSHDLDAPAGVEQPAAALAGDAGSASGTADVEGPDAADEADEADRMLPRLPALDRNVAALRAARPALRADVTRQQPATLLAPVAEELELPEGRELRRPGSVDLVEEPVPAGRVRPIAALGDPVEPLVLDDFVTEPAYDPVIGPELAAARTRVGLSVDELAERTRIRPHVIESIEVDDFAPCGGDFYARGHLRTLARVLGQDPQPLLAQFEQRYATAPINARKVFEAELATGMTGSMRSTLGGPNWSMLVGVVLCLVLVWGVVRFFATQPVEHLAPAPTLSGSAGLAHPEEHPAPVPAVAAPLHLAVVGTGAGTQVVVRDGSGKVIYAGTLVGGVRKPLVAAPPVQVHASDAGAVSVSVNGKDRGPVGPAGRPATRTFHRQG